MPLLGTLADIRDVFIIIWSVLAIVFFALAIIVTFFSYKGVRALMNKVGDLVDDNLKPAAGSIRDAADTVRGTTEFMGRTAVRPVARAYGVAAGVRQGLSILGGLSGRRKRRR